jgi:type III restriction enzyme
VIRAKGAPLRPGPCRRLPGGTCAEVDFLTTRGCHAATHSHIDQVVLDTATWEASPAFRLEKAAMDGPVECYARNDGTGFVIPYDYMGLPHSYEPDFLVRMRGGTTLILEIKGQARDQDDAKHEAARRWVTAVNNSRKLGQWAFHVCRDPQMLEKELNAAAQGCPVISQPPAPEDLVLLP